MFTIKLLKKATDSFSQSSIIGKGGFGTPNNQVVTVKKSLKVDKIQVEQFINEIIALSQINNKNVVKMLRCCLENEMPLLIHDITSNDTLQEHLHGES
ncbi:Wall-associated receptor kinase 1 [Bienertia sinuspersici]